MRVAIIGGGASGLITAYLLRHTHQTVVYEAAPILGGHIRTLNGNVKGVQLPGDVVAENGVLGFDLTAYPTFLRLAERLDLNLQPYVMHSGLFYADGRFWVTPSPYQKKTDSLRQRAMNLLRVMPLWGVSKRLLGSINRVTPDELKGRATSEIVPNLDEPCHQALLACFMLAFSMPFEKVAGMPADLTVAYVQGDQPPNWFCLRDGVYSYIEKMLVKMPEGHIQHCNARVTGVSRNDLGVTVSLEGRDDERFDKVVFATTPGQVLNILTDPSDAELKRFQAWSCNTFTTLAHRDAEIYKRFDTQVAGPCDYFRLLDDRGFGYNTYLNHGYGQPTDTPYSFAYNLEAEIDPSKILHRADHLTPNYTVSAFSSRDEIRSTNGNNHTFHVGAYLGNGLHEGAALSASNVSHLLGGEVL